MGTGANAQAATATPPTVPDALAAELLTGLGESAFVELTALVALENFPPVLSDGDAVLNGATGVVRSAAGTPVMAGTAEFDGERVARILVFRNPERLAGLRRL
ncbi:hypothetical protein [Cellulosimicrobium arenosum]|uniref:Uncharacterized protein n=1 Tax=Cellulosimicrobium arenosum TaxID=2708133 RepID=A0A927J2V3_9MICO|nr:hypothetical protein [Cellulosimicrobium arenosum]MBD8080772.1 hypothetical protein [Cellulosimicrobium arenosum]